MYIAWNSSCCSGALFDPCAAPCGENDHRRSGGVIDRERKKKLAIDINFFFHQYCFYRELSDLHRQHPLSVRPHIVRSLRKGDSADPCAPCSPGLDFNDNFAAQFFRSCDSFVCSRCGPAARDFESIRRKNGFALILVKSRHGVESSEIFG